MPPACLILLARWPISSRESGGGSIVNICSMMGMFGPDLSNYEGTDMGNPPPDYFFHKGGMFTLTRYLCRVLADKKVRVNSISPGGIFANQPEQFLKNYTKKVPVGRMANNDDIKGVVVFLASRSQCLHQWRKHPHGWRHACLM